MDAEQLRRAALVVSSLDTAAADQLLEQFEPDQAALIRRAMIELNEVDPRAEREALDAFFRDGAPRPVAAAAPAKSTPSTEPPLRFLHEATAAKLLPLIVGEHPQTIAVVISHLPPPRAAELLARLEPSLQIDVIRRLADLDQADEVSLREIEQVLQLRVVERIESEHRQQAGVQFLSSVLAEADADAKRSLLANIAQHDRQLAGQLTTHRWTFDDVMRLTVRDLALVLHTAGAEIVLLVVAGGSEAVAARCLDALPEDARHALTRSLDTLGPTRLADLEQAQHELTAVAQDLALAGKLEPPARRGRMLSLAA